MFKKTTLIQSMLIAMLAPSAVMAEATVTFEFKNETAVYTKSGQTIGQPTYLHKDVRIRSRAGD